MRIFHYTVGIRLLKILEDQKIKCATAFIGKKEKPVVWFSTNQEWEKTANKMWNDKKGRLISLSKEETEELGNGLVRIEVTPETAPYTWEDYKQKARVDRRILSGLYKVAKDQGADPREWRVSFVPVKMENWLSVELWDGEKWKEIAGKGGMVLIPEQE
jgi:hypothetical protein